MREKPAVSLSGKRLEPRWRLLFFSLSPANPPFLSFFPFSPSQFLLEAFAYFKSLPKKIAQGQKWTICILKTQQRANGGREREGVREREGGSVGGRRREEQGERKCLSKWFEDNLKVTIMSISWLCHAHYAGLIAVFTCTRTDYLLSCQGGFFFFPSAPSLFYGEEAEREARGRERERAGRKMCIIRRPLHPASFMNNK